MEGWVLFAVFCVGLVFGEETLPTNHTIFRATAQYPPETEYEYNFVSDVWINFTREHAEIPVFAVGLYLAFVANVPAMVKKPLPVRGLFALWNLFLATFSFCGVWRVTPYLFTVIREHGFHYTLCVDPNYWYAYGGVGVWVWVFVYSKIPELLDTVFLVCLKKPVIFLHWFHHTTVLLYCWHAFHHRIAPGIWFAVMNYWVHSVMYSYYFLMIFRINVSWAAMFITVMQLLQMVGGLVITSSAAYYNIQDPESCRIHPSNWKLGLGMYFAYFVLFACLFKDKYFGKKKVKQVAGSEPTKKTK